MGGWGEHSGQRTQLVVHSWNHTVCGLSLSLAGGKQKGWSTEGGDIGNEVGEEIS